jgi:YHS domain-containing protein
MSILVHSGGLALIGLIIWYFFLSSRGDPEGARSDGGLQHISVRVKGGYIPEVVLARAGVPLEIAFVREEESACSEEVVFPSLGIQRFLPAFQTTTLKIPASPKGSYPFSCGMNMLHGTLVLQEGAPESSTLPAPEIREEDFATDPICGMRVQKNRAAATRLRDGTSVYFCGPACEGRFEETYPSPVRTTK